MSFVSYGTRKLRLEESLHGGGSKKDCARLPMLIHIVTENLPVRMSELWAVGSVFSEEFEAVDGLYSLHTLLTNRRLD